MNWKICLLLAPTLLLAVSSAFAQPSRQTDPLQEFKARGANFNAAITLPEFELTTNAVRASVEQTISAGNEALDAIGALKPAQVSFQNTLRALDDIAYQIRLTDNRLTVIKETSTDAAIRDAAVDALKDLEVWIVGLDYREDVYKAVK